MKRLKKDIKILSCNDALSPPTNDRLEPSGFTEIYEHYGVKRVIYAHLHGKDFFQIRSAGEASRGLLLFDVLRLFRFSSIEDFGLSDSMRYILKFWR